jgi:hypothetical protein
MVTLVGAMFVMTTENSKSRKVLTRFVTGVMYADSPSCVNSGIREGGPKLTLVGQGEPGTKTRGGGIGLATLASAVS